MGIYDREYSRDEPTGFQLGGDRMLVTNLLLVTVGLYLVDTLLLSNRLTELAALRSDVFSRPWQLYQLLTYGFAHDPKNLMHVGFNMFFLWFFGRDIELTYGRRSFLWIYLTTIIVAGLVWLASTVGSGRPGILIGASGGTTGIMMLYVLNFPRRTILIWGVLPVPAWALGAIYLFSDISGAVARPDGSNVAYIAHVAGAGYGLLYYYTQWSLGSWFGGRVRMPSFSGRPRLKVHDPTEDEEAMTQEVDAILQKIQTQGQESLTAKEKRLLERASRRYQQKHR